MTWRLTDHREPEDGWRCPRCEALTVHPGRLCVTCEVALSFQEALPMRHAGHGRMMEPEGPGHRGYVKGDGPE